MNVSTENLDTMIARYAVLTNRPGWLADSVLDAQRRAWRDVIALIDEPGVLVVEDVVATIVALLYEVDIREVVPSRIIRRAAPLATARRAEAVSYLAKPEMVLYTEAIQYRDRCGRGDLDADKMLSADADRVRFVIANAGLAGTDVVRLLAAVSARVDALRAQMTRRVAIHEAPRDVAAADAAIEAFTQSSL